MSDIADDLVLIEGSNTDYITISGDVYTKYGDKFFKRAKTINKYNGYVYTSVRLCNGVKQRRLHKLIAETFIFNDDIEHKTIVMHIDNDKTNNNISNLKWGTISENTKQAHDDKLIVNDKGFEDSQSFPVAVFDVNKNLIGVCGSVSIAYKEYNVTKAGILYQCNHKVRNINRKPKCGYYFRFLEEYKEKGFVL